MLRTGSGGRRVAVAAAAAATAAAAAAILFGVRRWRRRARDALLARWASEQVALRARLEMEDAPVVAAMLESLRAGDGRTWRVGGLDVSYAKGNDAEAVASLVVVELPSLERVYGVHEKVILEGPYVAGFLAFREVPHFRRLLARVAREAPEAAPALLFVDGNGVLHPRGFGAASHVGVLAGIPAIGVAKTLLKVDGLDEREARAACKGLGLWESRLLIGASGRTWGAALRTSKPTAGHGFKPVYVSVGTGVTLPSAVELAALAALHRVPEPIRLADLEGRKVAARDILAKRGGWA